MHFSQQTSHRPVWFWVAAYVTLWIIVSYGLDPTVPYDAVEALNWGKTGEWGAPKNPWLVGMLMYPVIAFPDLIAADFYWYFIHFTGIGIGMCGVWYLTHRLTQRSDYAWLALLSLNLSGIINFDLIPYNDNYILVTFWPWMLYFFVRAVYDNPAWWIGFALTSGLATMGKYSTLALTGMVFLFTLFVPKARESYRSPWFYAAIAIWFTLVIPNVIWLMNNDFAAFKWVDSQIKTGLTLKTTGSLFTVFYPLIIIAVIIRLKGGRFGWPKEQARRLINIMILAPLAVIYVWFTFHQGGRITEWLQPFVLLCIPALICSVVTPPVKPLKNVMNGLIVFAVIVITGYAAVMGFNIRDAGQKNIGMKTFTAEAESWWEQETGKPLKYTGGEYLHEWVTFYGKHQPETLQPWINEFGHDYRATNIYNLHITRDDIRRHGALLIGKINRTCADEPFTGALEDWPDLVIAKRKQVVYQSQPGAKEEVVCLGIVRPEQ